MQTNTKILAKKFGYLSPDTLQEALTLLDVHKKNHLKILAGGTDLLVKMKTTDLNVDYLMSIKNIKELDYLDTDKGLKIGAITTLSHIIKEKKVKTDYTALFEGIHSMAAPAIRNMGTIAGNLGNASPAADTIPPLMVLGAKVKLQSKQGERTVFVEDFTTGVGKTVMEPDELISEIIIPEISKTSSSAFLKKSRVKADLSKINCAVYLERRSNVCQDCRIAFGSVATTVIRARKTEELLKGKVINVDVIHQAAIEASQEIKPIDDIRSTADYRLAMAGIMLRDAIELAWSRAVKGKRSKKSG